MITCLHCSRVFSTTSDVAQEAPNRNRDHLYIMTSAAFPGICKIGRSHDPQERASELHASMPFYINIYCVFWGLGSDEKKAHDALALFKMKDVPGQEWFEIEARDAVTAVARAIG